MFIGGGRDLRILSSIPGLKRPSQNDSVAGEVQLPREKMGRSQPVRSNVWVGEKVRKSSIVQHTGLDLSTV